VSDHLPECLVPDFTKGFWVCICKQLRRCAERTRLEDLPAVVEMYNAEYANGFDDGVASVGEDVKYGRRHFMVDPDNEQRLLKIPPHTVDAIRGDLEDEIRQDQCSICCTAGGVVAAAEFREGYRMGKKDAISGLDAVLEEYECVGSLLKQGSTALNIARNFITMWRGAHEPPEETTMTNHPSSAT